MGDFADEITYSDYADFNGVKFPTHMVEVQAGFAILDVRVNEVKPNVAVMLNVPENVAQAPPTTAKPAVNVQKKGRRRPNRRSSLYFFLGTFAPFLRASESPMAIACFLLLTLLPPFFPDLSVPRFRLCIARSTVF